MEYGVERAQVEADGVLLQVSVDEPCLVLFYHIGGEEVEGEVDVVAKLLEPQKGVGVGLEGAISLHALLS